MRTFDAADVEVISLKLEDGRREIDLLHTPTGIQIGEIVPSDESSLRTLERLMTRLRLQVEPDANNSPPQLPPSEECPYP
ncbi:MAG: hypothetical protein K2W96_10820 [Gemmataceae bacterium]|nr:hypothetical protein [Gemmataceae bacterium]